VRHIRGFLIFLLFFAVLAAVTYAFFGEELWNLSTTLVTSLGSDELMEGRLLDPTSSLYRNVLRSILILAAVLLGHIIVSFCFYYLICQSRKMYFPIALRGALTFGLLIFVAATVASELYVKPVYAENNMELARQIDQVCYALTAAAVLLCAVTLGPVSGRVRRIIRGIDRLALGEYDTPVRMSAGDELSALARHVNNFADTLSKRSLSETKRDNSYMQFVPQQLVSLMGVNTIDEVDRSTATSRDMAVMVVSFGFTGDVYQSDPETLFNNINEVIKRTSGVVAKNGGTIYVFSHESYTAVFPGGVENAISTAVEIRQGIVALNREREGRGAQPVAFCVAIDKGNVMMGIVGDDSRMVPTAVSPGLTTARMLARLCRMLDTNILCTMGVADEAGSYFVRYIGMTEDGSEPFRVYEIVDGDEYSMMSEKEETRQQFSKGVYTLYSRDFSAAKRIFMDIARRHREDGVARYYLYLADKCEKDPAEEVLLRIIRN